MKKNDSDRLLMLGADWRYLQIGEKSKQGDAFYCWDDQSEDYETWLYLQQPLTVDQSHSYARYVNFGVTSFDEEEISDVEEVLNEPILEKDWDKELDYLETPPASQGEYADLIEPSADNTNLANPPESIVVLPNVVINISINFDQPGVPKVDVSVRTQ